MRSTLSLCPVVHLPLCGYGAVFFQLIKEIEERLRCGLNRGEAEKTALCHVVDAFELASEISVCVPPGDELIDVVFGQVMFRGNRLPKFGGLLHAVVERSSGLGWALWLDAEVCGDLRPEPAPAEGVSVHDVEGLVVRCRCECGPFEMLREDACVGDVGEGVPLQMRTWEDEGLTRLAAKGGVDRERGAHIHRIATRVSDDRVGAVDVPCGVALRCFLEDDVFLGVVEVQAGQAWRVFAEGRFG